VSVAVQEVLRLTPVYEKVEGGWTHATIRELPAVITAAPSRAEAEELLLDALREFLMSFGDSSESDLRMGTASYGLTLTMSIGTSPAA
jgi:predicted RNase H-like HicB family nuclease